MYEGGVIILKVNTKKFYHILYSASSVGGSWVQIPRGPAAVKPECPADERGILSTSDGDGASVGMYPRRVSRGEFFCICVFL